jgi:hypothetical protein
MMVTVGRGRHTSAVADWEYFIAGLFLRESGSARNVTYLASCEGQFHSIDPARHLRVGGADQRQCGNAINHRVHAHDVFARYDGEYVWTSEQRIGVENAGYPSDEP